MTEMFYKKSNRLDNLGYAIRGPIFDKAQEMETAGGRIIRLNIGNPAPFGFDVSDEMLASMATQLRNAQGYTHHLGIISARESIARYALQTGIEGVHIDNIFLGNGVSELIMMTMEAMINNGDEILVPSPDYPLWTTAVALAGGKPVHYICDESSDWNPDLADIRRKVSSKTKAIVLINPNNPTGAVYQKDVLQSIMDLAIEKNLIILSDEIYDKILYDGHKHYPVAALGNEALVITYGGLSKNYMAAGFRAGWMILSGKTTQAQSLMEGLNLLASMRLCSNVPAQHLIKPALEGPQHIVDYVSPGGRLFEQRELIYKLINEIPGLSCVKPKGALYLFPKIDLKKFDFEDDESFVLKLLSEHKVLLVPGNGFNFSMRDHFRIVFLPKVEILEEAANQIQQFLEYHSVSNHVYESV